MSKTLSLRKKKKNPLRVRSMVKTDEKMKLGFDSHSPKLPPLVHDTISFLETNYITLEGIFRVPGPVPEIQELKKAYERGEHPSFIHVNPHSVSGLLKLFFIELPDPLFTFELYDCFQTAMQIPDEESRFACICNAMKILPVGNKAICTRLFDLLRKIAANCESNKMTALNLSIIFAPNLLRPEKMCPLHIMIEANKLSTLLMETFISCYDKIFLEKAKFVRALPSSTDYVGSNSPEEKIFIQSLKRGSQLLASQYILEKTNSELDEESVSELANLMIEGKDIDEFVKKKFSKDEEQTEPDEFYFQTLETGTLNLPNGTYEGQFKNGKPHGKGKLTYNNGDIYEGLFKEGKRHGLGILTESDGNVYEGDFAEDLKEGTGKYTLKNGNIYIGEMKNGKSNGHGVYYFASGGTYNGNWKDNLFEGKGIYYGNQSKYEGEFKAGKRHGTGTFITLNGNSYTGKYENGQMNGYGVYTFANGDKYEGEFSEGKFTGYGTYYFSSGIVQRGYFKDGKLEKEGSIPSNRTLKK